MATFTGSLATKRKSELIELAEALHVPNIEGKMAAVVKQIQTFLDENEPTLSILPEFKGLYYKKRSSTARSPSHLNGSDTESTSGDVKSAIMASARKSRKSINKAIEKVQSSFDAASIPLPESPVTVAKVKETAESTRALAVASLPNISKNLTSQVQDVSTAVMQYGGDHQKRIDGAVRELRDYLSTPQHLVISAVTIELLFLLCHVVQFYDHTYNFPPASGESGTLTSLLHTLYFWAPSFSLTFRLPELYALRPSADVWPAIAWWFSTTVLPALAMSTVISFVPHKAVHRQGMSTRHTPSQPTIPSPDPLSFSLFRLALLIFPLTSAAPSAFVDALEKSGNLQGRVLAAGLVVGLLIAEKFSA
ncbi:hypothetical protein P7C73_g325, partial [Tremellales sp. Uapishka_1]